MINKLEKAKEIIKENYKYFDCGIFNTRNLVGDDIGTLYNEDGLRIDACWNYSYFEVFGLSDEEFEELKEYYKSLRNYTEVK
jgi:hypothetical protein